MTQETYLQGLLIPKDWYSNGRVKSVALATDDDKEIVISNPMQNDIIRHLRHPVELWGTFEDPIQPSGFQVKRMKPRGSIRE